MPMAWILFDYYGWYAPYTHNKKTLFGLQTLHLVKNFYEAEYKRHNAKLVPPSKTVQTPITLLIMYQYSK